MALAPQFADRVLAKVAQQVPYVMICGEFKEKLRDEMITAMIRYSETVCLQSSGRDYLTQEAVEPTPICHPEEV